MVSAKKTENSSLLLYINMIRIRLIYDTPSWGWGGVLGGGVGRVEVGRKVRRHEKLPTSIPVIAT